MFISIAACMDKCFSVAPEKKMIVLIVYPVAFLRKEVVVHKCMDCGNIAPFRAESESGKTTRLRIQTDVKCDYGQKY